METENERRLAQAMWDALGILGFDLDGDPTPGATLAGGGVKAYCERFVALCEEMRATYDESMERDA